jgi:hypothetical protein
MPFLKAVDRRKATNANTPRAAGRPGDFRLRIVLGGPIMGEVGFVGSAWRMPSELYSLKAEWLVVTCREFFQGQSHIDTWAMAKRVVGATTRATNGVQLKRYDRLDTVSVAQRHSNSSERMQRGRP